MNQLILNNINDNRKDRIARAKEVVWTFLDSRDFTENSRDQKFCEFLHEYLQIHSQLIECRHRSMLECETFLTSFHRKEKSEGLANYLDVCISSTNNDIARYKRSLKKIRKSLDNYIRSGTGTTNIF